MSSTAIGKKKNLVWKEPGVDLPQQFTSVLGPWVTGDEDLLQMWFLGLVLLRGREAPKAKISRVEKDENAAAF